MEKKYLPEYAFKSDAMPCNPRPFAKRLLELTEQTMNAVESDEFKACLWVLNCQAYGQLSTIDLCDEWERLNKILTY